MSRITNEHLMSEIQNLQADSQKEYNPEQHKDQTRSGIATMFVNWFFRTIAGGVGIVLIYNQIIYWRWGCNNIEKMQDVMINLSSALPILVSAVSSPLGFVLGYYFKTESSK